MISYSSCVDDFLILGTNLTKSNHLKRKVRILEWSKVVSYNIGLSLISAELVMNITGKGHLNISEEYYLSGKDKKSMRRKNMQTFIVKYGVTVGLQNGET